MTLPPIDQGTLVALRFFEIADEADLRLAARLPLPAPLRVRPGRLSFVGQLRDLMLDVAVGVRHVPVGEGRAVDADTHVLVFAFGVGAVMAQIRIGQGSGGIAAGIGAAEAAQWVARFNDSDPFTAFARSELAGVLQHLAPALRRAFDWAGYETYCVLAVQRFGEPVAIDRVLASPDVARILLGESADWRPAPALVQQVTAHQFRYGEEDCCIVEWDAALVIDPHNLDDYTDLLSLGLTALLEFRRFDEILEREIGDLYEWLGQRGRGWHWLRIAATRQRLRQVHRLLLEVAEFVDRSENAFKITEDVYYARVYRGAIERFQVPGWRDSVQRRQRIVSDVASMLHNESQIAVSHLLEIIIIVLIAWEVVAALVR